MSIAYCPRPSLAADLLPSLRAHLVAAASRHMLQDGFSFDLLPIVDDGVFGYELGPQRATHTYRTLGCDSRGGRSGSMTEGTATSTRHWQWCTRCSPPGLRASISVECPTRRNTASR